MSTNINILPLKKITNDIERKSRGSMGSIKTLRKLWGQLHCPCNSVHFRPWSNSMSLTPTLPTEPGTLVTWKPNGALDLEPVFEENYEQNKRLRAVLRGAWHWNRRRAWHPSPEKCVRWPASYAPICWKERTWSKRFRSGVVNLIAACLKNYGCPIGARRSVHTPLLGISASDWSFPFRRWTLGWTRNNFLLCFLSNLYFWSRADGSFQNRICFPLSLLAASRCSWKWVDPSCTTLETAPLRDPHQSLRRPRSTLGLTRKKGFS